MSTNNSQPSQHPRLIGFNPLVSESPRYADNPFASREIALAWLSVLWRLFIGRYDTYACRPLGNGRLLRVPLPLNNDVLWDHVRGNHVIYAYVQHYFQRGVKICVLDVDCHGDGPDEEFHDLARRNFSYLEAIWRRLRELSLPVLLENSDGRGGLHLWMFVDNLSNTEAIAAAAWMASLAEPGDLQVERFPRASVANETKPGLCIRLPGSHHKRYHFSTFWNGENWINGVSALGILNQIQPVSVGGLPEEALRFRAPIPATAELSPLPQQHDWTNRPAPPIDILRQAIGCLREDYYDATRREWLTVGIGLHSCVRTAAQSQEYFEIWKTWSRQAPSRWIENDAVRDWDSFSSGGPFQWQDLLRLAMDEGYEPPTYWHPEYSRHLNHDPTTAVPYESPPLTGEAVRIEVQRQAVLQSRIDSVGGCGVFLDRSGTGSGKSTADLQIAARGHKVLVLVPDHTNVREIEAEATSRGLQVIAYPKRVYGSLDADQSNPPNPEVNCWNPDADRAQSAGLAIQHTVCRDCSHAMRCRGSGYLGAAIRVKDTRASRSSLIVMTHRRAQLTGLTKICRKYGIEYVAVHENLLEFIAPAFSVNAADVRHFLQLLQALYVSPNFVQRLGIIAEPMTTEPSRFARMAYDRQQDDNARLPPQDQEWRQNVRTWVSTAIEILTRLVSALTDDSATANEVNLSEVEFQVCNYPIQDLHGLLWRVRQHDDEQNTMGSSRSPARHPNDNRRRDVGQRNVVRLLMELTAGTVRRLVKVPATTRGPARLIAASRVNMPARIPVWLCDATAELENLRSVMPEVIDRTPAMHVTAHHRLLQLPDFDITRGQSTGPKSTVAKVLRRLLPMFPNKRRICLFCHSNQVDGIRQSQFANVTMIHYFHAGIARGSNSLYREHDWLVILGTPRAGGSATVIDRLVQLGEIDALNAPPEWGKRAIQITDNRRRTRVIEVRGYGHPVWNRAYKSIVEPELKQTIGRARYVLPDGCDVVVVSSQLVASEFLPFRATSLTDAQERTWQACRQIGGTFAPRDIQQFTNISKRTNSSAIGRLVEFGYLSKVEGTAGRNTRYQLAGERQEVRESAVDVVREEEMEEEDEDETDEDETDEI